MEIYRNLKCYRNWFAVEVKRCSWQNKIVFLQLCPWMETHEICWSIHHLSTNCYLQNLFDSKIVWNCCVLKFIQSVLYSRTAHDKPFKGRCYPSILYETNETKHGNYLDKNLLSTIYLSLGVKSPSLAKIKLKFA